MKFNQTLAITIPIHDLLKRSSQQKQIVTESVALVAQPKQYALDSDSISKESKALHLEIYKRSCEAFTRLSAEICSAVDKGNFETLAKIRHDFAAERNSVFLHELFFSNCFCRNSQLSISSISYSRLARDFGNFDDWQRDFFSRVKEIRSDGGWIVTCFDMFLRRFVNLTIIGDNFDVMIGCWPVIVVDCHEHAYIKDFNTNLSNYLEKMMSELNWDVINDRVVKTDMFSEGLK